MGKEALAFPHTLPSKFSLLTLPTSLHLSTHTLSMLRTRALLPVGLWQPWVLSPSLGPAVLHVWVPLSARPGPKHPPYPNRAAQSTPHQSIRGEPLGTICPRNQNHPKEKDGEALWVGIRKGPSGLSVTRIKEILTVGRSSRLKENK